MVVCSVIYGGFTNINYIFMHNYLKMQIIFNKKWVGMRYNAIKRAKQNNKSLLSLLARINIHDIAFLFKKYWSLPFPAIHQLHPKIENYQDHPILPLEAIKSLARGFRIQK